MKKTLISVRDTEVTFIIQNNNDKQNNNNKNRET